MRTKQDKINRKETHQRYMKKKLNIYPYHEEWAKENGYRDNDQLNTQNTIGFKDGAER